jgi:hypothetical protein
MANNQRKKGEEEPDSVSSAPESGQPAGGREPSQPGQADADADDSSAIEDDAASARRTLAEEKDDD